MSTFNWPRDNAELVAQLQKQRRRYEQLVSNMSDLLLLLDLDGEVTFCNREGPLPPGGPIYPAAGTSMLTYVVEDDRQTVAEAIEGTRTRRLAVREVFFRITDGAGRERIIEGTFTPVIEDDQVTALQFLGRDVTERRHAEDELRRTNIALQRTQKNLKRDLDVAAKIHTSLLPMPLETDRILIDLKHVALLGVGGDYVYIHREDPLRPSLTVFDVSGHGIASALVANRAHSAVHAIMSQGTPPPVMIERLNRFIYESFADLGVFVTLFGMQLDLEVGRACYCGSGHPPAMLRRGGTGEIIPLRSAHLPIGVAASAFLDEEPMQYVDIAPGDVIWLYTDGLVELRDRVGNMLGQAGLTERVRRTGMPEAAPGSAGKFLEAVLADNAPPEDDLTVVLIVLK